MKTKQYWDYCDECAEWVQPWGYDEHTRVRFWYQCACDHIWYTSFVVPDTLDLDSILKKDA